MMSWAAAFSAPKEMASMKIYSSIHCGASDFRVGSPAPSRERLFAEYAGDGG